MAFSCNVFLTFLRTSAAECFLFGAFSDRRFPEMLAKVTIPLRTSLEKSKNASEVVILRATPTAAGPSCCKRSVLWRTRGFGTLGFECFVGAVSGAYFV